METLIVSGQITPAQLRFNRRASPVRRAQSLRFSRRIAAAANLPAQTTEPDPKSANRMFIVGMGFVGKFFANELKNKGWDVQGTCKTYGSKTRLEEKGIGAHIFNPKNPKLNTLKAMKGCTHLLMTVPPSVFMGDPLIRHKELLRRELKNGDLKWLCYLSTTNVYGDHGGAWVDEDSTTNPETEKLEMRLAAEEGWLKMGDFLGASSFAFRLGGIYGPGRSAIHSIFKQGTESSNGIVRLAKQYTSRIHVEDVCQALEASTVKPTDRYVYNIVDDDPTSIKEVLPYALDLINKKWPGRVSESTLMNMQTEISTRGGKRVSNARMKNELGVSLRYPTYVSGLQSIIDQMEEPPIS